jgi:hypothetical protein
MMIHPTGRPRTKGYRCVTLAFVAIALAVFAIIASIVIGMIYLVDLMR